jgi:hypothetical protein
MTLDDRVAALEQWRAETAGILKELRLPQCRRGREDEDSVEALLEYIHDSFGATPWTSNQLFEQADENPLLYAAMVRCLGPEPTIQGLSKLIMRHRGPCGAFLLKCTKERGRLGAVFTVTHCVTASRMEESTVTRTTSRRS